MAYIDVGWTNGKKGLRWKGALSVAWDSKAMRFREVETLEMLQGYKLRCQLAVCGNVPKFPETLDWAVDNLPVVSLRVSGGKIDLVVPEMLAAASYSEKIKKLYWVYEATLGPFASRFRVKALATLQPPSGMMTVPDQWIWAGASAGLPSLGKKK